MGKWFAEERVMMLGCDVNHPPPQPACERGKPPKEPSVVGVSVRFARNLENLEKLLDFREKI